MINMISTEKTVLVVVRDTTLGIRKFVSLCPLIPFCVQKLASLAAPGF